jgi:curli production assembly/transport component CsgG/holdfast attachment protein HfaB
MNVGLDLRLVDTNTLEVVDVISYQKQIIGRQLSAGVFDFLGQHFFDASIGESALEPIQLAVRSVIERATLEIVSRLYRTPETACTSRLGTADDPLAGPGDRVSTQAKAAPAKIAPATSIEEKSHVAVQQNPYRYYSSNDPDGIGLRGGY